MRILLPVNTKTRPFFAGLAMLMMSLTMAAGSAHAQTFSTETGKVSFESDAPIGTFVGESDSLKGRVNLADSSFSFSFLLETLSTGIALRDKHMRDKYLKTKDYPLAKFDGKIVSGYTPGATDTLQVKAIGNLNSI